MQNAFWKKNAHCIDFWCNIDWSLFLSAGVFPPVWYKHVSEIAAKSPLLLSMGAEQFLDKELEVNHPLKIENIVPVSPQLYSNVAWVSCTSRLHM